MSDSWQPHGLQQARLPCPSPVPGVYSNSCPLSQWCHPAISFSVVTFSRLQSCPASVSFQMSQLFASGSQSIGISVSASVLPVTIQDWFPLGEIGCVQGGMAVDWFPLGWTGWISLLSKGLSRVFSNTTVQNINSSVLSFLHGPTLTSIRDYWKNHSFE